MQQTISLENNICIIIETNDGMQFEGQEWALKHNMNNKWLSEKSNKQKTVFEEI